MSMHLTTKYPAGFHRFSFYGVGKYLRTCSRQTLEDYFHVITCYSLATNLTAVPVELYLLFFAYQLTNPLASRIIQKRISDAEREAYAQGLDRYFEPAVQRGKQLLDEVRDKIDNHDQPLTDLPPELVARVLDGVLQTHFDQPNLMTISAAQLGWLGGEPRYRDCLVGLHDRLRDNLDLLGTRSRYGNFYRESTNFTAQQCFETTLDFFEELWQRPHDRPLPAFDFAGDAPAQNKLLALSQELIPPGPYDTIAFDYLFGVFLLQQAPSLRVAVQQLLRRIRDLLQQQYIYADYPLLTMRRDFKQEVPLYTEQI